MLIQLQTLESMEGKEPMPQMVGGSIIVTTDDGHQFQLSDIGHEQRDPGLIVGVRDGSIVARPIVSNRILLQQDRWNRKLRRDRWNRRKK